MKKPIIIASLLASIVILPQVARMTLAEDSTPVAVMTAGYLPIQHAVLASGHLQYKQEIELRSEVIGKVSDVYIEEGQRVNAGDTLLQIELDTLAASVEQQEASVNMQQIEIERQEILIRHRANELRRQRQLFQRQLLGEADYEQAQLELRLAEVDLRRKKESLFQAKAALQQAREQLAKTRIKAPIAGLVTVLDVKEGETVISGAVNIVGSSLAKIADTSEMMAEVYVDEADIGRVAVGQTVRLEAISFPGEVMNGRVKNIAIAPDYHGKVPALSFKVKVSIPASAQTAHFRPGISCRAEIITQTSDDYLAVPVAAVLYGQGVAGEDYVYVVEQGRARRRAVQLGISDDLNQAVLAGLEAGEQVITGPYRTLRELSAGQAVTAELALNNDRRLAAE